MYPQRHTPGQALPSPDEPYLLHCVRGSAVQFNDTDTTAHPLNLLMITVLCRTRCRYELYNVTADPYQMDNIYWSTDDATKTRLHQKTVVSGCCTTRNTLLRQAGVAVVLWVRGGREFLG